MVVWEVRSFTELVLHTAVRHDLMHDPTMKFGIDMVRLDDDDDA